MSVHRTNSEDGRGGLPSAGARARGIDRVIHVLEHLYRMNRPLRPNEIAAGVGAPKSTIYEIVHSLLAAGMLEAVDEDGRVFLGRRLYYYGSAYLKVFDLAAAATPFLEALTHETHETAQLCLLEGDKYTVAVTREGARHFRISSDIGRKIPLTWTASGRVLVSAMSDDAIAHFIPEQDFILPRGSRLAPDLFLRQVREARAQGFYTCDSVVDSFTHCFAAPVHDESGACVATMCLVVPREDAAKRHAELIAALRRHADRLSHDLGTGTAGSARPRG